MNPQTMQLRVRLIWLLVLLFVQALYFPINRSVTGGIVLNTPLDALIPVWPVWTVPYLLSLPWWVGSYLWAACRMDVQRYRAFVAAALFTMITSYVVYILYPTYVVRLPVEGSGWTYNLLRLVYQNDRLYNAFPSGHTYTTLLIVFFWWNWQTRLRWLWALIAVIVLLSTLFTGQHNLPDLLGGLVWARLGYFFGWRWSHWRSQRGDAQ